MTTAWALRTSASLAAVNDQYPALDAAGLLGIVEEEGTATLYFPRRVDDLPVDGRWEPVPDRDWNAAWMDGFRPVTVGAVTVVAPWHDAPASGITLVVEPAQAFGTGHHETTVRCLEALQAQDLRGRRVLDVGTGSGILALAAKALGAADVLGTDVDPVAVEAARRNAAVNGLTVRFEVGSTEPAAGRHFDVVAANLDTATITAVADRLATRLAVGGVLIVSGVSNERVGEALAALRAAGVEATSSTGSEWALIRAHRAAPVPRRR